MNEAPTKRAVGFYAGKTDPGWPKEVMDLSGDYQMELRNGNGCTSCLKNALRRKYSKLLAKLGWTAT